jgi:hypothetical protein
VNRVRPSRSIDPVRLGLALAVLVYLAYSSFGIAAPFYWGHHGYHGATYMLRARMSLRFHMLAPATYSGYDFPPANAFYFHHPIGYHHLLTLLIPIFGEHEWLARGLAAVGGLGALWALYALVARFWSRPLGLCAVVVYVCLPVVTSFSILSDPMMIELGCVAWSLWAYLSLLEKPSPRLYVHAAAAYVIGGLMMWEVFFIAPFIAAHAIGYRFTRRGEPLRDALLRHTVVIGLACIATMGFHIWFTHHTGLWDEFLESYRIRHSPPSAQYVIERHTTWVEILYGRTPVLAGAAWFAVWLARLAVGRARRRDLAPLTFLYVNTLYIYMFAEGSSVHLYRVFFYSGFFALAVTDLVAEAAGAARDLFRRRQAPLIAGVATLALYLGAEVPHAWSNLIESRVVMGTHGQIGYSTDADKWLFIKEAVARTRPDERVIVHYGHLGARKEMWYYLDRSFDEITNLAQLSKYTANFGRSVLVLDEHLLSGAERAQLIELIKKHPVFFYDHYTLVDLRSQKPGASSYAFVDGRMSRAYRWLVSHRYPPLHLTRAGYFPGLCMAAQNGVPVARDEAPPPQPTDARQWPCYHNYLVARGDAVAAARLAARMTDGLATVERSLGQAAHVSAAGIVGGKLRVAVIAGGPEAGELRYAVEREGLPPAYVPRSAAMAAPASWQRGFLYLDEVALPGKPSEVALELWKPSPPVAAPPPPVAAPTIVKTIAHAPAPAPAPAPTRAPAPARVPAPAPAPVPVPAPPPPPPPIVVSRAPLGPLPTR